MDYSHKIKFRIADVTSEDMYNTADELLKGHDSSGWQSNRFCQYPQEIYIQFPYNVQLKQINLLSHEKKIASVIDFYTFFPGNYYYDSNSDPKSLPFEKLGYIRMDNNVKTNFKAREFRRIFVNSNCSAAKIVLHKNYVNKFNAFNQVGLMYIEFVGEALPEVRKPAFEKQEQAAEQVKLEDMDEAIQEKIKKLKTLQEEAIKVEDFDEAKKLKMNIERTILIGKKLLTLEAEKKQAIENEDFDNAKLLKNEIENLKNMVKPVEKEKEEEREEQEKQEKQEVEKKALKETESKEKEAIDKQENSIAIEEKSEIRITVNKSLEKTDIEPEDQEVEEDIVDDDDMFDYDEQVIPALRKKKNPLEEDSQTIPVLEELPVNIKNTYDIFVPFIQEEGLQKIFSKHAQFREEGIELLTEGLDKIFKDKNNPNLNNFINLAMKLIYSLSNESHPQIEIKLIEVFEKLLKIIKGLDSNKLNYDESITDKILERIKERIGDVNIKLRSKAIELYVFMLKQHFCDYNNLVNELIEAKKNIDFRKVARGQNIILGRLSILNQLFDDLGSAFKEKRTDEKQFPFTNICGYLIENIHHSKSEIRQSARSVFIKLYKYFGYAKIDFLIKDIEERELVKLAKFVPEIKIYLKKQEEKKKEMEKVKKIPYKGRSKERKTSADYRGKKLRLNNNSFSLDKSMDQDKKSILTCAYCQKKDKNIKNERDLEQHLERDCLMFVHCIKCNKNILIKSYNNHMLEECEKKAEYKQCKRCKEAIETSTYESHVKDNKCNPGKNINASNRCPLCHSDIPAGDKGWYSHLVKDLCPKNKHKAVAAATVQPVKK